MTEAGPIVGFLFLLLFIDTFLYGYSAAILNLNENDIEKKADENDLKSKRLLKIIQFPERYVNTVQLIATTVNMTAGGLLVQYCSNHYNMTIAFATSIVLVYIFLTFGVLLPKRVASRHPEKFAYACVNFVHFIMIILVPITFLVSVTVQGILFVFGVRGNSDESDVTEEEIISMVQEGFEQGVIEDSEAEMISNIFAYGDKEAQDIMTHRSNVVAIDGNMHLKEAIDFMLAGTHSRYPVFEENMDHIIGILYLKDAMRYYRKDDKIDRSVKSLPGLIREAYFVPQTKNIDELFEHMQSKKVQMAIVVDEYGQMDGLVAMEDILEEIVGNIMDEYDEDTKYIQEKGNDEYVMEGKTPLEDLAERFEIDFEGENFETLNGFMISRLDHIPEPGEQFDVDYQGYNFKILSVENKMVHSVLVTKINS